MSGKLQAIRGMHDILPAQSNLWRKLEKTVINLLNVYDYREIRLPVVEKTELYARSIGESSDIVAKEMYTFADRNEDLLTLRPEGTAGCVRAGMEHGLLHNQIQKLWYQGPMFRHERPQKGRQRQFHQIGMEVFGLQGPDIDAELLLLTSRIWSTIKLDDIRLELNTLGTTPVRKKYRNILLQYFQDNKDQLDEDSLRRLESSPLRILDSKNPDLQQTISQAPIMLDYLDQESGDHFAELKEILELTGIEYHINPRLVRGLDYYGKTVFEWTTEALGAQGTVCAGGRYDGLVEHFGGKPTPAIGCAMGLERLVELMAASTDCGPVPPDVYLITVSREAVTLALRLAEKLHDDLPALQIHTHMGGGSLKTQFRKADRSGAKYALVLGEEELKNGTISVKSLRQDDKQISLNQAELSSWLSKNCKIN